jgi:GTP-binding protein
MEEISPKEQEEVLLRELKAYQPELLERPRLVVATKTDSAPTEVLEAWGGDKMSAVTGDGVREVLNKLAMLVADARTTEPPPQGPVTFRPEPQGTRVERISANEFRLHGRDIERSIALNDVTNADALNYIDDRMARLGVPRLLARAGATQGAVVWIGTFSFDYTPE